MRVEEYHCGDALLLYLEVLYIIAFNAFIFSGLRK